MEDNFYRDFAALHARHNFWSREQFVNPEGPIGNFITAFPCNHFSQTILNNYLPNYSVNDSPYPNVPDFPYWGSGLLTKPLRITIVADSNLGKGSLISNTLNAMLWSEDVRSILPQLSACFKYWDFSRYNRYANIFLDLWELKPDNLFVTDAFKCGKNNAEVKKRSQKVLLQELELVAPDFVITLGADSFRNVTGIQKLPQTTVKVDLCGHRATVIASPFPAGMGVTRVEFPARFARASWFIWQELHGWDAKEISLKLEKRRILLKEIFPGRLDKFHEALKEITG